MGIFTNIDFSPCCCFHRRRWRLSFFYFAQKYEWLVAICVKCQTYFIINKREKKWENRYIMHVCLEIGLQHNNNKIWNADYEFPICLLLYFPNWIYKLQFLQLRKIQLNKWAEKKQNMISFVVYFASTWRWRAKNVWHRKWWTFVKTNNNIQWI